MTGFCMSRAATRIRTRVHSHVRVRSTAQQYKKTASFIKSQDKSDGINVFSFNTTCLPESESESGNKVMIVVDSSLEARVALEWALSHTVQTHDTILLLHVAKKDGEIDQTAYDLLNSSKNVCQQKRPEVHVEMKVRERKKDKGATIVAEAKREKVSLLVLGQRKQSFLRRLHIIWTSKRNGSRFVDYCIQNANCMTIAVRKKNRKYGGYLITTKRHKNFWLLA